MSPAIALRALAMAALAACATPAHAQGVAKLLPADGAAGDRFGSAASLSADGTTALIGALGDDDSGTDSGSAYVFVRSGSSWTQQAKLMAADGAAEDFLGTSVSLSGDGNTALIGAYEDDTSDSNSGSAYVFVRSGSSWTQEDKLLAADGTALDRFGSAVSLSADGNTALIGAHNDGDSGFLSGSAYVFVRSGSSWSQEAKLLPADAAGEEIFGVSVSLNSDGNSALIGARFDDDSGSSSGSAYVFVRSASSWAQEAKLLAADGAEGDEFGWSVALSGDGGTALIGAHQEDSRGTDSGSAYVFVRSGATWAQEAKLLAADGTADDFFGRAVSLSADGAVALIGAHADTDGGSIAQIGSAYTFVRSGASWTQAAKLLASDGAEVDLFGDAVAMSGDGSTALLGAERDDDNGDNSGSALVVVRSIPCLAGQYAVPFSCPTCPAGSFCPEGATAPTACDTGELCGPGAASPAPCPAGSFCSTPASSELCPTDHYCPEGSTNATRCTTCAADEVVKAVCTASTDTLCDSVGKSDVELLIERILFGVAGLVGSTVLGLVVRHVVNKRSRRGHPVADRVRTLLKLGGVANFNAVRGQMFVVFVDDVALKMARALGLEQEEELDAEEAAEVIAGALNASHGFTEDGPCGGCSRKRPSVIFMGRAANADAVAVLVAAAFGKEAAAGGLAASSSSVDMASVELAERGGTTSAVAPSSGAGNASVEEQVALLGDQMRVVSEEMRGVLEAMQEHERRTNERLDRLER